MTTQAPVWEKTIKALPLTETVSDELLDFIDGHAADAAQSPQDYITDTFESEAEQSLEDAEADTFGFTMEDAYKVITAFSNWYTDH